jgi:transporter family protein
MICNRQSKIGNRAAVVGHPSPVKISTKRKPTMNWAVLSGGLGMFLAWGVWGLTAKIAIKHLGIQSLVWGQLAAVAMFPIYFLVFKEMLPLKMDSVGIAWALLTGALGILGTLFLYLTLRVGPASIVIPLSALYPVVTVILAYIFLHEELSLTRLLGIACALAAVWLLTT